MSDNDYTTATEAMLVIVLMELIKELRDSKSVDGAKLADRISAYVDDPRLEPAVQNALKQVVDVVRP